MRGVRISEVRLQDVGPFGQLTVPFPSKPGLNLICGDNGIGKTTILEAIAAVFSSGALQRLKRRQGGEDSGHVNLVGDSDGNRINTTFHVNSFDPQQQEWAHTTLGALSPSIIYVRTQRDFSYVIQNSISKDPVDNTLQPGERVANGTAPHEIKIWFTNRYLLRHHKDAGGWTEAMIKNLASAVSFFSLLDPSVRLERVDVRSFDVIMSTPNGLIPYEYLSSGFRSAYILLLGILKEIEYRALDVAAEDFNGVILIDELELHLHPVWQQQIGNVLKEAFPQAQIIASTHSPHIIQTALPSEVVALSRQESGAVAVKSVPSSEFGYAGWTLEEVLEDVMGVEDTKTPLFRAAMQDFDDALNNEDGDRVLAAKNRLLRMLHPNNSLRKLLEIQAAPYASHELPLEREP